jgi:hypothetical protein
MNSMNSGMITSADEFVRLRTSSERDLYSRAAGEPAPEEVWLEVIKKYPEMRKWVAHNKTVPNTILAVLADDPDYEVRWMVAQRRKADPAVLEKLARDPHESVRERVACNRKTPTTLLRRLADDPEAFVAEAAREQLQERDRATQ